MPPKRKSDKQDKKASSKKTKIQNSITAWLQEMTVKAEETFVAELNRNYADALKNKQDKIKIPILSESLTAEAYNRVPSTYTGKGDSYYFQLNGDGTINKKTYTTMKALFMVLQLEMPGSDMDESIPALTKFLQTFFTKQYITGGGMSTWNDYWATASNSVDTKAIFHPTVPQPSWMQQLSAKRPKFFTEVQVFRDVSKDGVPIAPFKDWEDYRLKFWPERTDNVNKNIQTKTAVEKQSKPAVLRLDEFEGIFQYWMKKVLIMDKDSPSYKTIKPDLADLRLVTTKQGRPDYYLPSHDMIRLGCLLHACVGSRLKGFALQNRIYPIPFALSLETLKTEMTNEVERPADELEKAVSNWLELGTRQRQNLVIVTGLSKQKSKETQERQRLLKSRYGDDKNKPDEEDLPDPTLVKPLLDVYLTTEEYMPLFYHYRRVIMYCVFQRLGTCCELESFDDEKDYFTKTYPKLMKAASKKPRGDVLKLPLEFKSILPDNFGLSTEETLPRSFVTTKIYAALQLESIAKFKQDMASIGIDKKLLKNTTGLHILRKMYVVWSYQLYAKRSVKEVAYSQTVLGHKDLNTSLRYTDIIIDLPTGTDKDLVAHFGQKIAELQWLVKTILQTQKTVEQNLLETTAVVDQARKDEIPRLPTRRLTVEERKQDPDADVKRVLTTLKQWIKTGVWPKSQPLSQKNMMVMGIGTELRGRVRRHPKFSKLAAKVGIQNQAASDKEEVEKEY